MTDRVWTHSDVAYVKEGPGLSPGADTDGWFLARKTTLTPMMAATGPLTVETQEGEYELPHGWRGYVAVDQAGYPYPIAADEFDITYEAINLTKGANA